MSENSPSALNQCLRAVWQRAQRKHLVAGLLAFARWFVPIFIGLVVIDRFAEAEQLLMSLFDAIDGTRKLQLFEKNFFDGGQSDRLYIYDGKQGLLSVLTFSCG